MILLRTRTRQVYRKVLENIDHKARTVEALRRIATVSVASTKKRATVIDYSIDYIGSSVVRLSA